MTRSQTLPTNVGRTRRWIAGAMLITVTMVAGGNASYAVTATNADRTALVARLR